MTVEEAGCTWVEGGGTESGGRKGGVVAGKGCKDGIEELDGKGGKRASNRGRKTTGSRRRWKGCYIQEEG